MRQKKPKSNSYKYFRKFKYFLKHIFPTPKEIRLVRIRNDIWMRERRTNPFDHPRPTGEGLSEVRPSELIRHLVRDSQER